MVCGSDSVRWARNVRLEVRMVLMKGESQGISFWFGGGTNGALRKKSAARRWVMLGWAQALKSRSLLWWSSSLVWRLCRLVVKLVAA